MARFEGTSGDDFLSGTNENDIMDGLGGNDEIQGRGGNDTINGGTGADVLDGEGGDDILRGGDDNDRLTSTTGGSDQLYGEGGNDILIMTVRDVAAVLLDGGDGDDVIQARIAAATIGGGAGNDTIYYSGGAFQSLAGTIDAGDGDDRITYDSPDDLFTPITLGAGSDTVRMIGSGARIVDFTAGTGGDRLDFSAFGPDPFGSGRFEARQEGADTWIVETSTQTVYVQLLNIQASNLTAFNLGLEQIIGTGAGETLTGTDGNDAIYGLGGNDVLEGLAGNDTLDGGEGADEMRGGEGDDIYFVDNAGDMPVEVGNNQGINRVYASVSYVLPFSGIQFLSTTDDAGTDPINLTGSDDTEVITGNAGNNILTADSLVQVTLIGLGGDDTYIGAGSTDIIVEGPDGGIDTVIASSFTLAPGVHVEIIRNPNPTSNFGTTFLTGNELHQTITGARSIDFIDSRGGGDILIGLEGNDTYSVQAGDIVVEVAGGGIDTVLARTDFVLSADAVVERFGPADYTALNGMTIRLTGNQYDQEIFGNTGANYLDGGGGADVLKGQAGNDFYFVDADDIVLELGPEAESTTSWHGRTMCSSPTPRSNSFRPPIIPAPTTSI
ncbi:calcium-binding protein [Sphingosinicella sp. LHD-64]|uniref:calcium-binding protein n=1 Tax=Sphingosinicella sp. LHD-64 TaxID=3072139 RepID=UPI00280F9371|nr:calcium-binding protein [Sphingosinicella sp. LHD-64]MDQ8755944.1 calcium-binding protein [Sphingosinicella sp. LHD-64]